MGLTSSSTGFAAAETSLEIKRRSPDDRVVAIAGNPNVGKSTIFNALTGMRQHTGNWPGKTVAAAQGYCETERSGYVLVDIPGTYSLLAHAAEEEAARDFLCFGGAESQDVEDREPGVNWWREEMPSEEEYAFCEENLAACDYKVDYVLTHDAPSRFLDFTALASGENNQLHSFLDKILLKLTYDKWFFGCYHKDTQLSTKSRCVFCDVISMGERHAKRSVR